MPYARTRSSTLPGRLNSPIAANLQLTGHISPRTPCVRMPMQP